MQLPYAPLSESALAARSWPVSFCAVTGLAGGAIFEGVE
jgi:hypothetical protein